MTPGTNHNDGGDDSRPNSETLICVDHILPKWFLHVEESHREHRTSIFTNNPMRDGLKVDKTVFPILIQTKTPQSEAILKSYRDFLEIHTAVSKSDTKASAKTTIETPPGHRLIVLLQTFVPTSVYERVYGQIVADSREEYYVAVDNGDELEAKKIKRHLNYCLLMTAFAYLAGLPFHLLSRCYNWLNKSE